MFAMQHWQCLRRLQHRVQPRATDRLHCTNLFAGLSARTEVHFVWCRHLRCHHVNVRHRCTGLLEAVAKMRAASWRRKLTAIPRVAARVYSYFGNRGCVTDVTEMRCAERPEKVNSLGAPRPRAKCAAARGLETTRPRDLHRARDPGVRTTAGIILHNNTTH